MQTWCCGWWWQLVVAEKYVAKFGSTSLWWKMCQIPPTRSSQKMVGQLIRNHFQKMDNVVCFVCASIHCLSNANAPLAIWLAVSASEKEQFFEVDHPKLRTHQNSNASSKNVKQLQKNSNNFKALQNTSKHFKHNLTQSQFGSQL
jgi:hypothetical protein